MAAGSLRSEGDSSDIPQYRYTGTGQVPGFGMFSFILWLELCLRCHGIADFVVQLPEYLPCFEHFGATVVTVHTWRIRSTAGRGVEKRISSVSSQ